MLAFVSWEGPYADLALGTWRVYASQNRGEKGECVATVPAADRSTYAELPEGGWWFRAIPVAKNGVEMLDWTAAESQFKQVHANDVTPSNPTTVGLGSCDPRLVGRVAFEAPARTDPPAYVQVIQGTSEYLGKLLAEVPIAQRGPLFPDATRQVSAEFPVDGKGGTRTVLARTMGFGGRAGSTPVSRTVVSPDVTEFHAATVATVSGASTAGLPAAAATDAWEYDATDGLRAKAFPVWDDLDADYGTYTGAGAGSWFDAPVGALYPAELKVETEEIDLGAAGLVFRLSILDTLARDNVTAPAVPWEDLTYLPWDAAGDEDLRAEAESNAWNFRETTWEGKPRQPIRSWRYEYIVSATSGFAHADSDYTPYVAGQFLTGRYLRVRLVVREPSGWYQIVCPTLTILALIARTDSTSGATPEAAQAAPPGSRHVDTGNGAVYFKRDGLGSTGWGSAAETVPQHHREIGVVSPAQITAQQDNYAPTGLGTAAVLRLTSDASRDITGISIAAFALEQNGILLTLLNVGSFDIVLKNGSASSSAANRFAFDADVTIPSNGGVQLWYDETSGRWRKKSIEAAGSSTPAGTLVARTVYSSGATNHTWNAATTQAVVTAYGGGAGGGGGDQTAGSASGVGAGGGAGAKAVKHFTGLTGGGTAAYSVGGGGAGGVAGNNAGTAGTDTTFSSLTAKGGLGGASQAAGTTPAFVAGGAGQTSTGGDVNGTGAPGESGMRFNAGTARSGAGGSTDLGSGGAAVIGNGAGVNGTGPGAGGSGACALGSGGSDLAGGNGAAGLIVVEEYT